jgi:hypothetical protein
VAKGVEQSIELRTARAPSAAASEPALGSVKQSSRGAPCWRAAETSDAAASLPKLSIIQAHRLSMEMYAETAGQLVANASKIGAASKRVRAEPPTSSRT